MIRIFSCVSLVISAIVLLAAASLYLSKDWLDAAIVSCSACPWLLGAIAGVLIDIKRAQRQQHLELLAAIAQGRR